MGPNIVLVYVAFFYSWKEKKYRLFLLVYDSIHVSDSMSMLRDLYC